VSAFASAGIVKPEFIVAHITDTRLDYDLEMCNNGHKARGFDSCGYNWLILRDGTVQESRGLVVGAHAKGYNAMSYGVGLVGRDDVTGAQVRAFVVLVERLGDLRVRPHYELNANKTCPTKNVWNMLTDALDL